MFRAYDPERDRLVAVKLFRLDLAPERVHQLAAELDVLIDTRFTHPVIAAPIAAGIAGVSAYLGQEFVAADSLDLVLREEGPAPPEKALRLAASLASVLDAAAACGLHHGALHPRDILVSADAARLTGLGVARALEGVGVTSPLRRPYTAPERAVPGDWDHRADIFSLAILIHELIWGRRLAGFGEQAAASVEAIAGGHLEQLREVFARALAETPGDRFDTAGAFVAALSGAFEPVKASSRSRSSRSSARSRKSEEVTPMITPQDVPLPLGEHAIEHSGPMNEANLANPVNPVDVEGEDDLSLSALERGSSAGDEVPDLSLVHADDESYHDEPVYERALESPDDVQDLDATDLEAAAVDAIQHDAVADEVSEEVSEDASGEAVSDVPAYFNHVEPLPTTSLRPLGLALIIGVAIGFAGGFPLGFRAQANPSDASPAVASAAPAVASAVTPASAPAGNLVAVNTPPANVPALPPATVPAAPPAGAVATMPAAKPAVAAVAKAVTPPAGFIAVRSTPSGARVLLDGRDVGRTPVTTKNVAHGSHEVRITRDGYTPVERRVSVSASKPSPSLAVSLEKTPPAPVPLQAKAAPSPAPAKRQGAGSLGVDSRPVGASVFVDGRLVGTTPLLLASVEPGDHAVRLERDGYKLWSASVHVGSGEKQRVAASLER